MLNLEMFILLSEWLPSLWEVAAVCLNRQSLGCEARICIGTTTLPQGSSIYSLPCALGHSVWSPTQS